MENYKKYLTDNMNMTDAEAELFLAGFELVNYNKGDFIQKEGDKSNIVRIIMEGSARGFINNYGKEVTTYFYFKYDHTYDYVTYLQQKRAITNIQALDNTKVIEMTKEALEFLNYEVIGFHRMSYNIFKINFIKIEKQRLEFITKSPKERYLNLLENNKNIILSVPQHQVASFIGISPEHLSRIRKSLVFS